MNPLFPRLQPVRRSLLALATLTACVSSLSVPAASPPQTSANSQPAFAPVELPVLRPSRSDIRRFVPLPGFLRPRQQVVVQTRVPGFLKTILVDIGDSVSAGQRLAELEAPELLADRARLRAEVKVAETEARRLQEARSKAPDLVTPQTLDAAIGRLEMARAQLERSEILIGFCRIDAPFAGVITARHADPGAYLAPGPSPQGSALVALSDIRSLRARVQVPEPESIHVHNGLPVRIFLEGAPSQPILSTIARHNHSLDDSTHSLAIEADLPNESLALRPGTFATVHLGLELHPQALVVPTEAVALERSAAFVFAVVDGRCKKTPVKLGFQDGPKTEILSGITDNSLIAASAKNAPPDGAPISAKEARP